MAFPSRPDRHRCHSWSGRSEASHRPPVRSPLRGTRCTPPLRSTRRSSGSSRPTLVHCGSVWLRYPLGCRRAAGRWSGSPRPRRRPWRSRAPLRGARRHRHGIRRTGVVDRRPGRCGGTAVAQLALAVAGTNVVGTLQLLGAREVVGLVGVCVLSGLGVAAVGCCRPCWRS